jgi:hypothetical protein
MSRGGGKIRESWNGVNLIFTFRRTPIQFFEDDDAIIWQYNSTGRYSVQSLYTIVNNRGVKQVYTHLVWKIQVPSGIHVFLWLLANDKVLTRDNPAKRRHVEDMSLPILQ